MTRLLLMLCLLVAPVAADAPYQLATLLSWQRRSYPAAVVTSGFYDPRGISRYRSTPGLHLGYDIAMPYGTPVLAAWPGVVTAIIPWYGEEYGLRVEHPDGSSATYGHIAPGLGIGARVQPGTVVGWIASDHLDVKMRDSRGLPFDFGSGVVTFVPLPPDPAVLWRQAREELVHLVQAEASYRPQPRPAPELQKLGLRVAPRRLPRAGSSRLPELRRAWERFRKLPRPARQPAWSECPRLEREWRSARESLDRAAQLYAAGLLARKAWEAAVQEESRWRLLAEIARAL